MSNSEKFLFGDDFSVPEAVRLEKKRKAEEPVVPMFTEEQVAQIKAAAFDEGRQSGLTEAQQNAQTALNGIMQQILDSLHQSMSYLEQYAQFNENEAIHLSYAIASKIAPYAVAQYPRAEIEALLRDCLDKMHAEPRMIIRVNNELQQEIEELVGGLAQQAGFEGRILMRADPGIALPDVQVEWTNGGVSRTMQDVMAEIDAVVAAYMAPVEEEQGAEAPMNTEQAGDPTQMQEQEHSGASVDAQNGSEGEIPA